MEERVLPLSAKDFEEYDKFMGAMTNILQKVVGKEGSTPFYIAGDLDFGFMCADEDEEPRDVYGPQWWHEMDADTGGFKETMCNILGPRVDTCAT